MSDQIILAWKVKVAGTSFGPAQAASAIAAVPLYANPTTDPVLGQALGLTVASDATTQDAVSATRTLTLNMTSAVGTPPAPPPFPCRPDTAAPPVLPYTLRKAVSLAGAFLTVNGSATVKTAASQLPAVNHLDVVEFLSQLGVYYTVNTVSQSGVTLFTPYTGKTADGKAVRIVAAPAKIPALYSTSALDRDTIDFEPLETPGPGAQTVSLTYRDSTGAGPFTVVTSLSGKYPAVVSLSGGGADVASIVDLHVASTGGFGNSIGQITLVDMSALPPPIPDSEDPADSLQEFLKLQDQAQTLIDRALAYLPPSYFALAAQGAATPTLAGDFLVTTGSASVPTTVDQTAAIAAGNTIQFASQLSNDTPFGPEPVFYTVAAVSPKIVELTAPYSGFDRTTKYDSNNAPRPSNVTADADNQPTAATLVTPSPAAPPSNAQLAALLAQYVNPGDAVPPPNPPLAPQAMLPAPTLLSGMFAQTLSLAMAVQVEAQPIAFA